MDLAEPEGGGGKLGSSAFDGIWHTRRRRGGRWWCTRRRRWWRVFNVKYWQ